MNRSLPLFDNSSDQFSFPPPVEQTPVKPGLELSRFDHLPARQQSDVRTFTPVADGRHRVCIAALELGFAASSGNPLLKYGLRVDEGPFHNRMLWKRSAITVNTLRYLKRELAICGLTLPTLSDLPARVQDLHGLLLDITKVTRGEHAEVYFNSRIGRSSGGTAEDRVLVDPRVNLRHFDEAYRSEAVETQEPWASLPDALYEVAVERVELTQARVSGNPLLKWTLRITGSAFRNRLLWKRQALTENTLQFVKQDLAVCGLQLEKMAALPEHLPLLEGIELEVAKISRGSDSNVFFRRRLGAGADGTAEMAEDDIPF